MTHFPCSFSTFRATTAIIGQALNLTRAIGCGPHPMRPVTSMWSSLAGAALPRPHPGLRSGNFGTTIHCDDARPRYINLKSLSNGNWEACQDHGHGRTRTRTRAHTHIHVCIVNTTIQSSHGGQRLRKSSTQCCSASLRVL